jgi:hypothetical protein
MAYQAVGGVLGVPGLACLYEQRGRDGEEIWVSPRMGRERYDLSDETRNKGLRKLTDQGLLTLARRPVPCRSLFDERFRPGAWAEGPRSLGLRDSAAMPPSERSADAHGTSRTVLAPKARKTRRPEGEERPASPAHTPVPPVDSGMDATRPHDAAGPPRQAGWPANRSRRCGRLDHAYPLVPDRRLLLS